MLAPSLSSALSMRWRVILLHSMFLTSDFLHSTRFTSNLQSSCSKLHAVDEMAGDCPKIRGSTTRRWRLNTKDFLVSASRSQWRRPVFSSSLLLSRLELSDTQVFEPEKGALLGTASYCCKVVTCHSSANFLLFEPLRKGIESPTGLLECDQATNLETHSTARQFVLPKPTPQNLPTSEYERD